METHSRSSLFLMELIITIFFFAITACVCVQIFAKAHTTSVHAANMNSAQNQASTIADIIGNNPDPSAMIQEYYPDAALSDSQVTLSYDKAWNPTADSASVYTLKASWTDETALRTIHITTSSASEELYTLDASFHLPFHASLKGGDTDE